MSARLADWADDGQMAEYFAEQEAMHSLAVERTVRPARGDDDGSAAASAVLSVAVALVVVAVGIGMAGSPVGIWLLGVVVVAATLVMLCSRTTVFPGKGSRRVGTAELPAEDIDRQVVAAYAVTGGDSR